MKNPLLVCFLLTSATTLWHLTLKWHLHLQPSRHAAEEEMHMPMSDHNDRLVVHSTTTDEVSNIDPLISINKNDKASTSSTSSGFVTPEGPQHENDNASQMGSDEEKMDSESAVEPSGIYDASTDGAVDNIDNNADTDAIDDSNENSKGEEIDEIPNNMNAPPATGNRRDDNDWKTKAWTAECQTHMFYNGTWGKTMAPFADKYQVKQLVNESVPSVKIVPTLAVFTMDEEGGPLPGTFIQSVLSLAASHSSTGMILKPTFGSGNIHEIFNNTSRTLKMTGYKKKNKALAAKSKVPVPLTVESITAIQKMLNLELRKGFFDQKRQVQYKHIHPRRVIVEERLPMDKMKTYEWVVVNGKAIFVMDSWCDGNATTSYMGGITQTFYSTNRVPLNMATHHTVASCPGDDPGLSISMFQRMVLAAEALGRLVPGVVRVDLMTIGQEIYFSEFTFTSSMCSHFFSPFLADALLYYTAHGIIAPPSATQVERIINRDDWGYLQECVRQKGHEKEIPRPKKPKRVRENIRYELIDWSRYK